MLERKNLEVFLNLQLCVGGLILRFWWIKMIYMKVHRVALQVLVTFS